MPTAVTMVTINARYTLSTASKPFPIMTKKGSSTLVWLQFPLKQGQHGIWHLFITIPSLTWIYLHIKCTHCCGWCSICHSAGNRMCPNGEDGIGWLSTHHITIRQSTSCHSWLWIWHCRTSLSRCCCNCYTSWACQRWWCWKCTKLNHYQRQFYV